MSTSSARTARVLVAARPAVAPRRARSSRLTTRLFGLGFSGPAVMLVIVFMVVPLLWAFWLSLHNLETFGPSTWLAFNNYLDLAVDPAFWRAGLNTLVFSVLTVPTAMALGLAAAMLLNDALPARPLLRTIVFLPLVISGISTGLVGAWTFDENNGVVNDVVHALGMSGPAWQSSGIGAMAALVLMTLWVRVGFDMLIYLAGLQGVDPALYEAAALDGVNAWQRLRHVTLPQIRPATFFLLVMNVIYAFQVFDTVYAMTGGGPGDATTTLVTYAYKVGFDERGGGELGYAAAVGIVIYAVTALFTLGQWWHGRRTGAEVDV